MGIPAVLSMFTVIMAAAVFLTAAAVLLYNHRVVRAVVAFGFSAAAVGIAIQVAHLSDWTRRLMDRASESGSLVVDTTAGHTFMTLMPDWAMTTPFAVAGVAFISAIVLAVIERVRDRAAHPLREGAMHRAA